MNSQECSRELPQPGERWRHFKGGEYVIVEIASLLRKALSDPEIPTHLRQWVIYSKTGEFHPCDPIFSTEDGTVFLVHPELISSIVFAGYTWGESDKTEKTIWARPLDNFMGIVSSPCGEQSSNCYRFERITSPVSA